MRILGQSITATYTITVLKLKEQKYVQLFTMVRFLRRIEPVTANSQHVMSTP